MPNSKKNQILQKFINLIPEKPEESYKNKKKAFQRNSSKFSFQNLTAFILSIVASGKDKGIQIKIGDFFQDSFRSGLFETSSSAHRSSFTKAREKVNWQFFEDLFYASVRLSYDIAPPQKQDLWHGMSVFAFDGSKVQLPSSKELRQTFDPQSGLENPGKGHYPACLVSTVYDVFRRLPVARTVVGVHEASEREEAEKMLKQIPPGNINLYDRGYPSYEFIRAHLDLYDGHFVFRSPASNTFKAVTSFVTSKKTETILWISPSGKMVRKTAKKDRKDLESIKVRAIRLVSPEGEVSVLLTNLYDKKRFTCEELIGLYFRRWEVENYYRDEKNTLELETFHTKKENGVRQELFAVATMSVITRTMMAVASQEIEKGKEPQFKNSIMKLAKETALFVSKKMKWVKEVFFCLLERIKETLYYRPKKKRDTYPRVTKQPVNKWIQNKCKKLHNVNKSSPTVRE